MILAAWPGIGKTWAANNIQGITDMEPDEYKRADPMDTALQTHESKPTPQHPDRLDNYIDAIWNAHRAGRTVLTTMHPSVHHALQDRGAVIATIAPRREDKNKYLKRYRARGRLERIRTIRMIKGRRTPWPTIPTRGLVQNKALPSRESVHAAVVASPSPKRGDRTGLRSLVENTPPPRTSTRRQPRNLPEGLSGPALARAVLAELGRR